MIKTEIIEKLLVPLYPQNHLISNWRFVLKQWVIEDKQRKRKIIMHTFADMGLNEQILKALTEIGFEEPTPIQEKSIPHILASEKDLVALAQTGTGKTAAFSLPIIHKIDPTQRQVQSLILCPTRELCIQTARAIKTFIPYLRDIDVTAVYGGANIEGQISQLRKGPQIVVGTPGRTLDLIKRRRLKVDAIQWLVLDEADEMLTMGFKDELDGILSETPETKQTLLFSATMPNEISRIAQKYMHEPIEVSAGQKNIGAKNVTHTYFVVRSNDRYLALKRIADMNPEIYAIVFCRTRKETKEIAEQLMQDHYRADAIHGDLSQAQRDQVMHRFRKKGLQLLVATDVAARGIDVDNLSHVINYKLPEQLESYIHRSGRTGRAGNTGTCVSIVQTKESSKIKALERKIGKSFEKQMVPTGHEICQKRLFDLIDKVEKVVVDQKDVDAFLPDIHAKLDYLDKEELINKFVSVTFNRYLEYYKDAPDLNVNQRGRDRDDRGRRDRDDRGFRRDRDDRGRRDRDDRGFRGGRDRDEREERGGHDDRGFRGGRIAFKRFYINVGGKNDLNPLRLIGLINDLMPIKNIEIGKIEILKNFSFFEIDGQYLRDVINAMNGADFEGIRLVVEESKANSFAPKEKSGFFRDKKPFAKRKDKDKGKKKRKRHLVR